MPAKKAHFRPCVSLGLTFLGFIVFALLGGGVLLSRDTKYLVDYAGEAKIDIGLSYDGIYKLGADEAGAYRQSRQHLVDLILAQPAAKPPRGVSLVGLARAYPPVAMGKPDHPGWPVPTLCIVHFNDIFERNGKADWATDSPVEMQVYMNEPERAGFETYSNGEMKDSKGRTIFYQANKIGEVQGFPVYRNKSNTEIMILSRNRRPIWLPLSQEEYLNLWIRTMEKELAEMGDYAKDPSNLLRKRLERHRTILAGLSPAERQAQAMYLRSEDPFEPDLAFKASEWAWPLVIVNPEWFDPASPRTAVQFISVIFDYGSTFDPDDPKPGDDGTVAALRLLNMKSTSDWKTMSSSLLEH